MIAGSLGIVDDPLPSQHLESNAFGSGSVLDVQDTQEYLDDRTVQHGMAAGQVETRTEQIYVDGTTVDTKQAGSHEQVATEWVADVSGAGFVTASSTAGSDPEFPFGLFRAACGRPVEPARIAPGDFVAARQDAIADSDDVGIWYAGRKTERPDDDVPDDVEMAYGARARRQAAKNAEVGVGFTTPWQGTTVKGVLFASGYVAIYEDTWGPVQFARFVGDAILPHASVPDEESADGRQAQLAGGDA